MMRNLIQLIWIIVCVSLSTQMMAQELPEDIGSGWELSWSDEFDYSDSELEENWTSQNSANSGDIVLCSRWRENAEVHDGILELKAIKESRGGQDWTCGSIWTNETFGFGYYESRYKYAAATGTNNSFWLWPRQGVRPGNDRFEWDINEGKYPNIVKTNLHNWDLPVGDWHWEARQIEHVVGNANERQTGYTHVFETPVTTNKIRFSSTNGIHFHIGEFRIYAPNEMGYPSNPISETADTDVAGLINYTRDASTTISASGQLEVEGRSTDPENVGDGGVAPVGQSWISQRADEKWLEVTLGEEREIGCVQFTNGWYDGNWNALIEDYTLEYWDGAEWVEFDSFDVAGDTDLGEEYHVYGGLWTPTEMKFYIDGELVRTVPHTENSSESNIYLSLAILNFNIGGQVTDAIDGTSMKVDYVRYYENESIETVTNVKDSDVQKVNIFPNPATDVLNFTGIQGFDYIVLHDMQGKVQVSQSIQGVESLDLSTLSSGVYFYRLSGSEEVVSGTFIKK